ncbi:hypothetical protein BLNAU_8645 [Blattamonas nauphoetae]|uniref:SH3 domain-containing protein n=1 Tax=Blattamonas nauphoetae TaxID=2049346 RepID=A0ABQ9XY77_9EUKA|nr:hypothetical protein BLNAU_8645 [Blattamonas nauphoetae]
MHPSNWVEVENRTTKCTGLVPLWSLHTSYSHYGYGVHSSRFVRPIEIFVENLPLDITTQEIIHLCQEKATILTCYIFPQHPAVIAPRALLHCYLNEPFSVFKEQLESNPIRNSTPVVTFFPRLRNTTFSVFNFSEKHPQYATVIAGQEVEIIEPTVNGKIKVRVLDTNAVGYLPCDHLFHTEFRLASSTLHYSFAFLVLKRPEQMPEVIAHGNTLMFDGCHPMASVASIDRMKSIRIQNLPSSVTPLMIKSFYEDLDVVEVFIFETDRLGVSDAIVAFSNGEDKDTALQKPPKLSLFGIPSSVVPVDYIDYKWTFPFQTIPLPGFPGSPPLFDYVPVPPSTFRLSLNTERISSLHTWKRSVQTFLSSFGHLRRLNFFPPPRDKKSISLLVTIHLSIPEDVFVHQLRNNSNENVRFLVEKAPTILPPQNITTIPNATVVIYTNPQTQQLMSLDVQAGDVVVLLGIVNFHHIFVQNTRSNEEGVVPTAVLDQDQFSKISEEDKSIGVQTSFEIANLPKGFRLNQLVYHLGPYGRDITTAQNESILPPQVVQISMTLTVAPSTFLRNFNKQEIYQTRPIARMLSVQPKPLPQPNNPPSAQPTQPEVPTLNVTTVREDYDGTAVDGGDYAILSVKKGTQVYKLKEVNGWMEVRLIGSDDQGLVPLRILTDTSISTSELSFQVQNRPVSLICPTPDYFVTHDNVISRTAFDKNTGGIPRQHTIFLKKPFENGLWSIEIKLLNRGRKLDMMFGVMDAENPMPTPKQAIGLHIPRSASYHMAGKINVLTQRSSRFKSDAQRINPGSIVRMELDLQTPYQSGTTNTARTVRFFHNHQETKSLVTGLPRSLLLGVSLFGENTSVAFLHIGQRSSPTPLSHELVPVAFLDEDPSPTT